MIDNAVVPVASNYGLSKEYRYLKSSIAEYLTGLFSFFKLIYVHMLTYS